MSDALPKKRVRRGIDKDREDERESLMDRATHPPPPSMTTSSVKKNPSRALPDHTGFYMLSSSEIGNDSKSIANDSRMAIVPAPEKSKPEGSRDKDRYSLGVVKRSLRPPCAPEATLFKKIQRYFHWVNDPSLIPEDLKAYKDVVEKLHGELLELEMESIRWHANVNTLRAEYANMESSLTSQILEQERIETELSALLLREFASVDEIAKGDSCHGTRGKAAMSVEDVAARLANFDSAVTAQLEACLALSQQEEVKLGCDESLMDVVTDPESGEVLICSFQPQSKVIDTVARPQSIETVSAQVTTENTAAEMDVEEHNPKAKRDEAVAEVIDSVLDEVTGKVVEDSSSQPSSQAESKVGEAERGGSISSSSKLEELPALPAIVSYVEAKKRKIHDMTAVDIFAETLHQSSGRLFALGLPDEVERPHNYFKTKRIPGTVPPLGDRQRAEVEALAAADKYSSAPLAGYMSLLQHPYKIGALEGLGQRPSSGGSVAPAASVTTSKGRGRGGKASGGSSATSGGPGSHGHNEATVAMHMEALRRTPCEVPLVLSPFSALEGWYAGTYQPLAFPSRNARRPGTSSSPTVHNPVSDGSVITDYNIEHQEHFKHPQFIQVGERYLSMINTLTSATQRAQIELADVEKEEAEWKSQVNSSAAALQKAEDALIAVREGCREQEGGLRLGATFGAGDRNGVLGGGAGGGVGAGGAAAGVFTSTSSSERDGLLGLLGMSAVNGNGSGDLNGNAANKKLLDSKKLAAKKKAAARRRR